MKIHVLGRPVNKERLLNAWAIFNMYQNRGQDLINQFMKFTTVVTLSAGIKILFPAIQNWMFIPLGMVFFTMTFFMGYYDKNKLGLWKVQIEKARTHVDPYNQRIEQKLDRLLERKDGN